MRPVVIALLSLAALRAEQPPNTLSANEKKAGWQLLFDGTTWNGWDVHQAADGRESVWVIEDGWIRARARTQEVRRFGTDIASKALFDDIELPLFMGRPE